uniref:NADH dehydrogenase subunit 6 n=1 Tax=Cryptocellus narino TaxID=1329480 RepID=W5R4I3_9ARAC|nr:NADH dehydrogenase subunit 6 [Cryptocellus narino]AGL11929.1 NADH dehydrogenase subunit 6 [Cryptocellus narino]
MTMKMITTTIFLKSKHPIPMIMSLITFTILTSTKGFIIHNKAGFKYTITLIKIGGMKVIFIYMAPPLPNKKLKFHIPMIITTPTLWLKLPSHTTTIMSQTLMTNPILEFTTSLTTLIMASYLQITLLIMNKTTIHLEKPIRSHS